MIDKRMIFDIHRLKDEGWSQRAIARHLLISRKVVKKYLVNPDVSPPARGKRPGMLDSFRDKIGELLEQDPGVSAVVIKQRIGEMGYKGRITILRDYLRDYRRRRVTAYIRFETPPGKQCQVDWGYFGTLVYGNTKRKLYCFAMIEGHSRMLYLEFTHSMTMEAFLRCHMHAFEFFHGTPNEIVHDNLKTAVIERVGKIIRFHEGYLDFLRRFHIVPHACNVRAAWEKGKIEKGGIHYIRHNFWPCRKFTDLADVNAQALQWRDTVANVRIHATTGEKPVERFRPASMRPMPPGLDMDLRDTATPRVHRDARIQFDANYYSVPAWTITMRVTVKADNERLCVYYKGRFIASHPRSWERKKVTENPNHIRTTIENRRRAMRSKNEELWFSLGPDAEAYLRGLADAGQPLEEAVTKLLDLKNLWGKHAVLSAVRLAAGYKAYGVDYIENILHQQANPPSNLPPVVLDRPELNDLRLDELDLKSYDADILEQRSHHDGNDANTDR